MAQNLKKAAEEADRMIIALTKGDGGEPGEQPDATPATTEPVEPAQNVIPEGGADNQDVPATVVNPEPVEPDALASLRAEIQTANQRWQVLQGMVNKKDSEIEQLRTLLAQLSQSAGKAPSQPEPQSKLVTEKDVEEFGVDMVDLIGRKATETVTPIVAQAVAQLREEIARLEKSIGGVSEATSQIAADTFEDALTRAVPTWREINVDPEFISWLSEIEGFTGYTKLELLKDAYAAGDLPRTVRFFEAFSATKTAAPAPVPQPTVPVKNAEKYVSPSKSKPQATPQSDTKETRIWDKASIQQLYEDRRTRRITAEEFDRLERDLFQAQRENRVAA